MVVGWNGRHYFVSNRIEQREPYFQLVEQLLPSGRKNAREVYDCPGALFAVTHYPIRIDRVVHSTVVWEQIMEITALTMKPFWEHYQQSGCETPFLRQSANRIHVFAAVNGLT